MDAFESVDVTSYQKKIRGPDHPELEIVLLKWFKQMHSENIAINGPLLKFWFLQCKRGLADAIQESQWLRE